MVQIKKNIQSLLRQLGNAKLMVVTKNRTPNEIREVIKTGVKFIGENKLQEIQGKYDQSLFRELKKNKVELHFIGHLQSNKVNKVVLLCDAIQSVDSLELAKKINYSAERLRKNMPIFLQLNLTDEEQKYGIPVETLHATSLREIVSEINSMENIKLVGFMCLGKDDNEEITRKAFRLCKELANKFELPEVSMGMSNDYQIALEEGSTMVRLGSIIFE